MSTSPVNLNSAATASNNPTATSPGTGSIANENVFLQLLVAQLKYQDPSQPSDGTAFVSELAQFTDVSNTTSMSSDLGSILQLMQGTATPAASNSPNAVQATSGTPNQVTNS